MENQLINYLESIIEHYEECEEVYTGSSKEYFRGRKESYEDLLYRVTGGM